MKLHYLALSVIILLCNAVYAITSINTTSDFKNKVVNSKKPSIVKFTAKWCGPCKGFAPIIERLEKTYNNKINFFSVDIDIAKDLAKEHGILSIPAVLFVKDEKITKVIERTEAGLKNKIKTVFKIN